nr:RNA-dependent RNA polymerase [Sclerotium hydrophilum virus 3]
MEYLTAAFNRISQFFSAPKNFQLVGTYHYRPAAPHLNQDTYEAHQRVVYNSMERYLYPAELDRIVNQLRRSTIDQDSILADFLSGDVEPFEPKMDEHFEYGLRCMLDAFRAPTPCLPCHLNDVEHHYPYKWMVNAEPPFATDEYFLANRHYYRDFWNEHTQNWDKYVNPLDLARRQGFQPLDAVLDTITPPKFGFMKSAIFSWTRRWLHIVKNGFQDTTGLESNTYLRDRFIFPMLLHTKTAIVEKDDPNKMRTIWGVSKPWIIADTQLWWEYIAWVKLNPGTTPMLWGFETFTGGWFRLNRILFESLIRNSFLTLDWSRFDKRAYFSVILRIMQGVRTFLDFEQGYCPTKDYPEYPDWNHNKAIRLERLFLWTLENLFNAPIVLPDGKMYKRLIAGIPSGLFVTQLLDSWYNYTMLATLLSALGFDPKGCIIKVQGDDSIIRLSVLIPSSAHEDFLNRLAELALEYFNAVLSIKKSEIRNRLNGCEVLSYRHHQGLPYREEIAMLAQLYHTEARNPTPETTMSRAIGFAYAACGNHRRVHYCLENLYNFYKEKGFTANHAGLSLVFGDSPDRADLPIDIDHFPTMSEVKKFLTATNYTNSEQMNKTWPLSHFLSPPCSRA